MVPSIPRSRFLLLLLIPATALSYEGQVRRQAIDGGVHQPVLTKPPELLYSAPAKYPDEAMRQGLTADVPMAITIAADGSVSDAKVRRPAGHGFDEAALEAARNFRFSPGEVDGAAASVQIEYVYHFTLTAPAAPEPPMRPQVLLKGQLVATGSRARVEAASVRCVNLEDATEAISDADGRFQLQFPAGTCRLKVIANGYEVYQTEETLNSEQSIDVTYHLMPKSAGYETVVRAPREKKEVVRRTLDRQELQKIPGSFGDPIRVLQNLPGVARAPFVSGQLIVRGATPSQTDTLMDGISIPLLYHLGGGPSVLNAEFLDRIDFYPGGFGARYGRAIGGIVDVATRKGASDTLHGVGKIDPLDASIFVEAPLGNGVSLAAAARRSYVDALLPLVLPKDPEGGTLLIVPRYWDYQVRMDIGSQRGADASQGINSFYVMAFGSDDVLKVVATGGGRNRDLTVDAHTLFHRVKGDWTFRRGPLTSVFSPYIGYDAGTGRFGTTSNFKANDSRVGARQDFALELSRSARLRTGADVVFDHLTGSAEFPILGGTQYVGFPGAQPRVETQVLDRSVNSLDAALYAELDLIHGPLTVTPGIRLMQAQIRGRVLRTGDPRLWLRYRLSEPTALKASVGLYSQTPNATDMDNPPFGNPNLTFQRAFQTSLGVEHKFSDVWNIDLVGYFNRRFDNVVAPGQTIVNPDGSVTKERVSNEGLGRAYGVEVLLRHQVTRDFFGWLAYTFSRSESRRAGEDNYALTSFDETHILTLVASRRLPLNFELGARFRYVTGRPVTPTLHPYDIYASDANRYYPTLGDTRSGRLSAFHQLDVRLDKHFLFQSWTLTLYLDVQNVYNAHNMEAILYDYRFRDSVAVPGIPILPLLGVRASF
jgi:TonB family protein